MKQLPLSNENPKQQNGRKKLELAEHRKELEVKLKEMKGNWKQ